MRSSPGIRGALAVSCGCDGSTIRSSSSVRKVTIPGKLGSPCGASGSRSVDNCNAVNPSTALAPLSWHVRQSSREGIVWRLPGTTSATPRTPSSGARTASVCESFQTYDANDQACSLARHSIRVSTLRPSKANSFQKRVPIGNSHWSTFRASIVAPGGSRIHRAFRAPSVHSGYCGAKARFCGSTACVPGRYRPVCDNRSGIGSLAHMLTTSVAASTAVSPLLTAPSPPRGRSARARDCARASATAGMRIPP